MKSRNRRLGWIVLLLAVSVAIVTGVQSRAGAQQAWPARPVRVIVPITAGSGTATQLSAERFRLGAGFEGIHVPFKGTPEALNDVITGRVDFYFCPVISVVQFIKEGKLVALATGSSKRSSALPDVPTTLEA